jgi:hypothetical protein
LSDADSFKTPHALINISGAHRRRAPTERAMAGPPFSSIRGKCQPPNNRRNINWLCGPWYRVVICGVQTNPVHINNVLSIRYTAMSIVLLSIRIK